MNLAAGSNADGVIGGFAIVLVLIALYWLPTFIAWRRHVHGLGQVVIVNLFLGWTGIGWVVALVMAFRHVPANPQSPRTPPPPPGYGYPPSGGKGQAESPAWTAIHAGLFSC